MAGGLTGGAGVVGNVADWVADVVEGHYEETGEEDKDEETEAAKVYAEARGRWEGGSV